MILFNSKETTVYLIRHGETEWNRQLRFQGHQDSPLTKTGKRQANALGRRMREINFDDLYTSDLGRARHTAEIIAGFSGHGIRLDARLRERNYGVLEGLTEKETNARFPEVLSRFRSYDPEYIIPHGESHRRHYERNIDFIHDKAVSRPGKKIAVVAHGGVLDSYFRYICRQTLNQPRCFSAGNTSLAELICGSFNGAVRWIIKTWGDVSHLNKI